MIDTGRPRPSCCGRSSSRPVTKAEVASLVKFVGLAKANGQSTEQGIQLALEAILVSPNFLFRIEHDAKPTDPSAAHPISDIELASRLSFFLWSSIPDDQLLDVAARGTLHEPAVLEREVRRMLADPRSAALVNNFAGQWLQLRNLDAMLPDWALFPNFDDGVRLAFRRETELFFESILREERGIPELLTAGYTFVTLDLRGYRMGSLNEGLFMRPA